MIEDWITNPEKVGVIALLLVAIASLVRGWVIPGAMHDSIVTSIHKANQEKYDLLLHNCQRWEQIATKGTATAQTAVNVLEKTTAGNKL